MTEFAFERISPARALRMVAALCAMMPALSFAQTGTGSAAAGTGDQGSIILDIIVTANKRSERLQDVGIAATAFSGEQIARLGFTSATDIVKLTPAVSIYAFSPSVPNINIRGVVQNDFADHLEPPVAIYQDEAYVGTSGAIAVPLFDMQRVEVLRGPQGTLFGRNATGGLIHYISAEPTQELDGYLQASSGRFNSYNVEGAVSGGLADGLRGRFSFARNRSDGPFRNVLVGGGRAGNTDNWAVRAQIAADLGPATELRLIGRYVRDDQNGPMYSNNVLKADANGLGTPVGANEVATFPNIILGGTVTAPCAGCNIVSYKDADGNPWTSVSSYTGFFKRSVYGGQARLTHDFGNGIQFTALSDYLEVNKRIQYDNDATPAQFFIFGTRQRYRQFSQELRLNGDRGPFKWVAGAYYLHMDGTYRSTVDLDLSPYVGAPICMGVTCSIGGNVPEHFQADWNLRTESWALFAQGEYRLSDRWSATLGARYTHDAKRFDYAFTSLPQAQPDVAYNPSNNPNADRTFQNVSLKAQLDWRPVDGTLAYLSYTRGHKGGNWSAPVFPPIITANMPHRQEVLTSYETGVKTRFLGGMGTFNATAFYYDYHDYQAFSIVNLSQAIFNVDATSYGGEVEVRLAPARGLEVGATAATVHSKVKDVTLPSGVLVNRELPNAPDLQMTGLVRYGWAMFGGEMSVQADGKYMGSHFLTTLNEPSSREKAWATLDLRAAWLSPNKALELSVYGQNVTSTRYRVWALDVSALSLGMQVYAPRATYGVRARYNF